MTNEIVKHQPLTPDVWRMIQDVAPFAKDSRLFGVATAPQAIMIMAKGHELGLPLTTSFEYIHVIQDKPTLSPRGALAIIMGSPVCAGVKIDEQRDNKGNPTACSVTMKRVNGVEYTATFTMEDAKRADLVKAGGGWEKYPANMLKWRAVGYAADVVFPDVIGGMKRADEFDAAITPDGDVIATTWTVEPKQPQKPAAPTLQQLMEKYPAEKILEANNNAIPSTADEIAAVIEKLEAEVAEIEAIDVESSQEVEP